MRSVWGWFGISDEGVTSVAVQRHGAVTVEALMASRESPARARIGEATRMSSLRTRVLQNTVAQRSGVMASPGEEVLTYGGMAVTTRKVPFEK